MLREYRDTRLTRSAAVQVTLTPTLASTPTPTPTPDPNPNPYPNPTPTPAPTPHQGLSRFASDIIIRGFDTPCKLGFYDGRLLALT